MRMEQDRSLPARTVVLWASLALLLPTLYCKHGQLLSLYPGGLSTIMRSVLDHPTRLRHGHCDVDRGW